MAFIYSLIWNDKIKVLPVVYDSMTTKIKDQNSTVNIVSVGENIIPKDIGLRELSLKILLPKEINSLVEDTANFEEPIQYLNFFRNWKISKERGQLVIYRYLPDGTQIFNGNMPVVISDYTVTENANEPGDFYVTLGLKEFRTIDVSVTTLTGTTDSDGNAEATQTTQRETKETASSYTVASGDYLYKIAGEQLGDCSRWKEIYELNKDTIGDDPDVISVGMVLTLPS